MKELELSVFIEIAEARNMTSTTGEKLMSRQAVDPLSVLAKARVVQVSTSYMKGLERS